MKLQGLGYAELGRQLKIAREKAGLTQEELARRLESDQSTVAKIEAGTRRVDVLKFAEICDVLVTSREEILSAARNLAVNGGASGNPRLTREYPKPEYSILE